RGDLRQAGHHFRRIVDHGPVRYDRPVWYYFDIHELAHGMLARVLCLEGLLDTSRTSALGVLERVIASDHRLLSCFMLGESTLHVAMMIKDYALVEQLAATLITLSRRINVRFWENLGACFESAALIRRGNVEQGVMQLKRALDNSLSMGWMLSYPQFQSVLA